MDDDAYPARLRTIPDLPPTLFALGALHAPDVPHVAVVGTRSPSAQARAQAIQAGKQLADAGAVVISGMANGVDGLVQTAALEVPGSYSVGVLGSGVLKPYPPQNAALAHMLRLYGALVCEVAPDATVSVPGLVARNRVISGMADAVLIIETSDDGGAMHAARAAYRQGRALYAVENNASGNRALLKNGHAQPVAPNLSNLLDGLG
jgi:DNA processing protein